MKKKLNNIDIDAAAAAYKKFMQELGLDLADPNAIDTPMRVAKMYRDDIFSGLYNTPPKITAFENVYKYDGIVYQGDIPVKSVCAHHHCPFIGRAYVAYIPSNTGKIIGLSKLNRIVDYLSRRPQVQENLTMQIHDYIADVIGDNEGVAVYIKCKHTCVSLRGIKHDSEMKTAKLSGQFYDDDKARNEFYLFTQN